MANAEWAAQTDVALREKAQASRERQTAEHRLTDRLQELSSQPTAAHWSVVTLRGRGVPHLSRSVGRGDLHVHLEVETPSRLDPEQERLLRELASLRGEESGDYIVTSTDASAPGLFTRLRDAFK